MAQYSPIMAAVKRFADAGGPVVGVCNGFQILCESWSPARNVLIRNHQLHFVCDFVESARRALRARLFTSRAPLGTVLRHPDQARRGRLLGRPSSWLRPRGAGPDLPALLRCRRPRDRRCRQPQRLGRERGGGDERARQRVRADAAPRARGGEPGSAVSTASVLLGSLVDACWCRSRPMSDAARAGTVDLALAREHGLTDAEYANILAILGRTPTLLRARRSSR